jgi:LysM repeat protein
MSNIFSVVNKGSNSYFNLAKTINFNNINSIPDTYYTVYMVQEGDTWTNISYKAYGTINPWWIICKFNNIKNPFTDLIVGKKIKLPT